ncbi:MAG: MoaD/ThiS family protein [Peptococcaceae bacterium]|nr:MoaD/ThiS family protein [Peptococcaceae bacterium]
MIEVQLYGVARLQAGVAKLELDENQVKTLQDLKGVLPNISRKEANDLLVLVNGGRVKRNYRFQNGDIVVLLSPAGGG